MSECVIQMEMPQGCDDCPFRDILLCCRAKGKYAGSSPVRPNWCPIICQLPEGHGRLVSEKGVRWAIDDIVIKIAERIGHVPMTKNETMEYVNQLPTIIPAERSEV